MQSQGNPWGEIVKGFVDGIKQGIQNKVQEVQQVEIMKWLESDRKLQQFDGLKVDSYRVSPLITPEMKEQFYRDGYVVVPNAIPKPLVDRALRAINRSLGQGPNALPPDSPFRNIPPIVTRCPELMIEDEITDLLRKSEAMGCAQALIGNATNRTWAGQIALRFPGDLCIPSDHIKKLYSQSGIIGQIFVRKGLETMYNVQKQSGEQYANKKYEEGTICISSDEMIVRLHGITHLGRSLAHRWVAKSDCALQSTKWRGELHHVSR